MSCDCKTSLLSLMTPASGLHLAAHTEPACKFGAGLHGFGRSTGNCLEAVQGFCMHLAGANLTSMHVDA